MARVRYWSGKLNGSLPISTIYLFNDIVGFCRRANRKDSLSGDSEGSSDWVVRLSLKY